jgi:hypothetical protein
MKRRLDHQRIAGILGSETEPVTPATKFKNIPVAAAIGLEDYDHTGPFGEVPCPACAKFKTQPKEKC